jgi:rhomboid protease GluP
MYILTAFLSGSIFNADVYALIALGAKQNTLIVQGEYYRFITAMFLHGGIIHLGFNMYALKAIGPTIEKAFGKIKYLLIYFLGGAISVIASFVFSEEVSIGASGAIFALLGSTLILALRMKDKLGKEMVRNILSVIAINIFIGFSMPNIDNFAHIGGLVGGIAVTSLLKNNDSF